MPFFHVVFVPSLEILEFWHLNFHQQIGFGPSFFVGAVLRLASPIQALKACFSDSNENLEKSNETLDLDRDSFL